jgi:hypothetical protein
LIWIKAVSIEDGNYETMTTRMQPSVIVWDLETVPDLGGFAAANDLVGKSDVEVREAIGDKFPIAQFFAAQPSMRTSRGPAMGWRVTS